MKVEVRRGELAGRRTGAVALGVFEGEKALSRAARALDRATRGALGRLLASGDFQGRFLETAVLYAGGPGAPRAIVVGLGPAAAMTRQRALLAAATAARKARDLKARRLATAPLGIPSLELAAAAQATAEGAVLGHHRYQAYRRDPGSPPLRAVEIAGSDPAAAPRVKAAAERGARWGEAVCLARDLAMTPGQDLTPEHLAARAREIGRQAGARVQVMGAPEIERLGMGALMAVGRGSQNPPRFLVLDRGPRGAASPPVVVIGKGITFDTGGISLKPRENMHRMKYDMSGAAAVLGLFSALPTLELPFRVVGLVAAAENMPGGRALKPGDVVRTMDGTSIEVTNTDAEGRLVLADALGYARRLEPAVVLDLATLTGAISIALGNLAAGLFTDDDALAAELTEAGEATGERLWRLPVWDDYAKEMRSDVADLVNSSGAREGGAILGAVFLKQFARGMRWAHLDIAGTAWAYTDRPHELRGATGFGVRLLLEWLSRRSSRERSGASRPAAGARRAARSGRG